MKSAALVVGCQDYPHLPAPAVESAVADALAVRTWLLAAGRVASADLRLLLSPVPGNPVDTRVSVDGPADLDCFTEQLRSLLTEGSGDRLYVYIAARSCSSESATPFLGQPLILLRDFHPTGSGHGSVAVDELSAHLTHADFGEVVTILDCAREGRVGRRVRPVGLGAAWRGRRQAGAAMQFRLQSPGETAWVAGHLDAPSTGGALTAAFLSAVAPAGPGPAVPPVERRDPAGQRLRWSALERYLISALPAALPTISGPDPGMTLPWVDPDPASAATGSTAIPPVTGPPVTGPPLTGPAPGSAGLAGPAAAKDAGAGGPGALQGGVEVRCDDPNAMLMVEDETGVRRAVGVGSISGHLPVGSYTALLADPSGPDPRVPLTVTSSTPARVTLAPHPRPDGFRVTAEPAVQWSSPAAQLAMATSGLWAYGHQSFVLVGGAPGLPGGAELLDDYPDRFAATGVLTTAGAGWWAALPASGLWHAIAVDGHLLTVPAAPDSVTAVAISPSSVSVALFDTTHPEPTEIAAQDRVQEYLAIGRLGAADLTSRSAVHAGRRWPWGASAAVRRLIDRTRASRVDGHPAAVDGAELHPDVPPHEFRADVPPPLRRFLVGRGPWAVWLDWAAVRAATDGPGRAHAG